MSSSSGAKRKGSPCQQDDDHPQAAKKRGYSAPELPKDIWDYIHSLLPLPDAARAGCVSRAFLSSWRCYSNLIFSRETLGLDGNVHPRHEPARIFEKRVDRIMRKHSGIGLKTFNLNYYGSALRDRYLNRWLQIAVTLGIEEVILSVPLKYYSDAGYYNFPCSLLFNGSGNSIRHLNLTRCAFHPTAGLGCLTKLSLSQVHITGDELACLLSSSFAMEELHLIHCDKLSWLKIPCLLQQLTCLTVFQCSALEVIENRAPNLSIVRINGVEEKLPNGDFLQVKELEMMFYYESNLVYHARAKLPFIMPNLETLNLRSPGEMFNTPTLPVKFCYLKKLEISLLDVQMRGFSPAYDYFSLVSFLDACPVLETFILGVSQSRVKHALISDGDSHLRQMPGHRHGNIKNVKIRGFCSAKSMVELTCHILENATSLECLTLDPIYDYCSPEHDDSSCVLNSRCHRVIGRHMIKQAHRGLWAIERYVVGKIPSAVKLNVKKMCPRCHTVKRK